MLQDGQAVVMKTMTRAVLTEKDKLEVRCANQFDGCQIYTVKFRMQSIVGPCFASPQRRLHVQHGAERGFSS